MNNHAPRSILKVDATSINTRQNGLLNAILMIYNINIPEQTVQNRNMLLTSLQQVADLISNDFQFKRVVYQITASYLLEHIETGQTRTWTGSFFVKNNTLAQVSDFTVFDRNNFVRTSTNDINNIENKLLLRNVNTKWRFNRLLSVIFNVQCAVDSREPILNTRELKEPRKHKTFSFP